MKILISLFMISLLNTVAFAGIEQIVIQDFSLHYDGQNGQGSFRKIGVSTESIEFNADQYNIDLTKNSDHMMLSKPDTAIKLRTIDGDMLSSVGMIQIEGLNFNLLKNRNLSLSVASAQVEIGDGSHQFDNVSLNCTSGQTRNGDVLSFLLPCMTAGAFYMPEIILANESKKSFSEAFDISTFTSKYINDGEDFNTDGLTPKKLRDVKVLIKNNDFNLSAKVKILFNLKVKGTGKIYYHALNSEIEIHLDKIKVGFINITKKVLSTVAKANLKNVRISGQSVFIAL